ncbi:hypothetical protein MTR_2g027210 [Medicago truncatula]|uniref:Uncharacterized protein n=1 Tax=Medicago truncatula TaxID=3880 RepID=G7IQ27_MEDTR|nr:hypothetical protein MTR_2g027210 [Medicago truncatula]
MVNLVKNHRKKSLLILNALTHGARALTKHACRSSSGYWGSLVGNITPHGVVIQIRVADGYGARWSEDGSKVRGQISSIFSTRNIDAY